MHTMTQEQIMYQNTCFDLATGEYRNHPLKSIGNIIHYLRGYGLREYDTVTIGFDGSVGKVTLWGNVIATYTFNETMPIFTFIDKYDWLQAKQDNYIACKDVYPNPHKTNN